MILDSTHVRVVIHCLWNARLFHEHLRPSLVNSVGLMTACSGLSAQSQPCATTLPRDPHLGLGMHIVVQSSSGDVTPLMYLTLVKLDIPTVSMTPKETYVTLRASLFHTKQGRCPEPP